jgi:hypothetical protein
VVGAEGGPLRKEKAASGGGSGKTESDDDQFIASPESAVIASDENLVVIPNHLALDSSGRRSRHYDRPIGSLSRQLGETHRLTRNHWPPTGERNSLTMPTKAHLAGLEAHQEET